MMWLLRAPEIGAAGYSTPVTCDISRSYFAFQGHAERYHGWRLGG